MQHHVLKPLPLAFALSLASLAGVSHAAQAPDTRAPSEAPASSAVFDIHELDASVAPCADLNRFVNDKWIASHPIPADQGAWDIFTELAEKSRAIQRDIIEAAERHADTAKPDSIEQKIGWLYRSGMDEAAIEKAGYDPIKPVLAEIDALENRAQIADFINRSFAQGDQQVFGFSAGADFKDADTMIGYTEQAGIYLPSEYYLGASHAAERKALRAYIVRSLKLIGTPAAQAEHQADQAMAFETALAGASLAPVALREPANQYRFISVKQADKLTPHFSWERFFAAQGVTIDKGFSLAQPTFFAEFDRLLARAPVAQWKAYLRFHLIADHSSRLSKAFTDSTFELQQAVSGQAKQKPRWKRVIGAISENMSFALGQLYAEREFTPQAKQRALTLVRDLLGAFRQRIEQLDWMSPQTKRNALAKLDQIVPRIGYPDHWRDWSGLEIRPEGYFENRHRIEQFNYRYDLAKIGKPADRSEWSTIVAPQEVNAAYDPQTNTVSFPAAILQPPFFYAHGDDAMNYGAIGAIIGHEISHAFDDEGSQFDAHGNQANWWSEQDRAHFEQRAAKLVDQFNKYHPLAAKPDEHVNGQLTLGENIADLGGLNVAYDALQLALARQPAAATDRIDGYTPDQRFFLAWGRAWRMHVSDKRAELLLTIDVHAPSALRANAAPSNMQTFAAAFQCKPGSPMVRAPGEQVNIW